MPAGPWFGYEPITVKVDDRENFQPGFKFNEWETKGVPIRVELGPKDLAQNACVLARRDLPGKEAKMMGVPLAAAPAKIVGLLKDMQKALFDKAKAFREQNLVEVDTFDDFKKKIEEPGGFLLAHWDGTRATEDRIAAETKATIRCIPDQYAKQPGKCILSGQPSAGRVVFAKAY